jgi:hypothetical protein
MESGHLCTLGAPGVRERLRLKHIRLGQPDLAGARDRLLAQASFAAG